VRIGIVVPGRRFPCAIAAEARLGYPSATGGKGTPLDPKTERHALAALVLLLGACGGGGGGGGGPDSPPAPLNPNVGLRALEQFDRLAVLPSGVRATNFSSFDRSGGNDDGFSGHNPATGVNAFLYFDFMAAEFVLFEVEGAGVVDRMNFARMGGASTHPLFFQPGLDDYDLRFYFDGATTPQLTFSFVELTSGTVPGFPKPLVGDEFDSAGGEFSYFPLPFTTGMRIAASGLPHFYTIHADLFPSAAGVQTYSPADDPSAVLAMLTSVGQDPKPASVLDTSVPFVQSVPPNGTANLVQLAGSGTITAVRIRPLNGWTEAARRDVRLQVLYEGETVPRVDAPLGLLFGSGISGDPIASLAFGRFPDGTGYLYFPMPFLLSATVRLSNGTGGFIPFEGEIRWQPGSYGEPFGYFSTNHVLVPNPVLGEDVVLLDRVGHGRVVGVVGEITIDDAPFGRVFLEGDERVFLDDVRTPAIHGTATETFFGWNWYDGPLDSPFQLPLHGYPAHEVLGAQDRTGCYRLFFGDDIPFERSVLFGLEHGPINTSDGTVEALVFFYLADLPALVLTDTFDPGDPGDEAAHGYSVTPLASLRSVTAAFEGREATLVSDDGYVVGGESLFNVSVLASNVGVRLVRLSDQRDERQRALVYVDGALVGPWSVSRTNPFSYWLEDSFEIPASFTAGKSTLQIRIVPTGNGTSWNEFLYRVYARVAP